MEFAGTVAIVTGGAGGIGAAIGKALLNAGANVLLTDVDADRGLHVCAGLAADAAGRVAFVAADSSESCDIARTIQAATERFGPVDLYFANAGVGVGQGLDAPESDWTAAMELNVMAHIRAARLLVPAWLERGRGYFVSTASAAGLLTQLGSPTYSVSKAGAVAFAEWLAVTYGAQGIGVSCLCPMGVNTAMLHAGVTADQHEANVAAKAVMMSGRVVEPDTVAQLTLQAVRSEQFLILPHPEVAEFEQRKVGDRGRWISGMQRYLSELA